MILKVLRNYLNMKLKSYSTINYSRTFSTIRIQSTIYTNSSNSTSHPSNVLVPSISKEHFQKYLEKICNDYEAIIEIPDKKKVEHIKEFDRIIYLYKQRQRTLKNLRDLLVMKQVESDKDMLSLIDDDVRNYENMLLEVDEHLLDNIVLVNDDQYNGPLILEVSAGVGGQESMIFAGEIFNMYCEYTMYKQWQLNIIELENTDIGGIRHASAIITGNDAYSLLRYEAGVHRVQRIPTTEKAGRIHTSTTSVSVIKNYDNITIDLKDKDLRIETKRASGAGGQHVNTTDSAVRIVHLPSGLSVDCQTERSQIRNKEMAMIKLKTKLWQQKIDELNATKRSLKKSQIGSNYRNEKIRTYNFNQDRITDHRVVSGVDGGTLHNLKGFLQGGQHFDEFIINIRKQQRYLILKELMKINV